jgi:hypothetical protein
MDRHGQKGQFRPLLTPIPAIEAGEATGFFNMYPPNCAKSCLPSDFVTLLFLTVPISPSRSNLCGYGATNPRVAQTPRIPIVMSPHTFSIEASEA